MTSTQKRAATMAVNHLSPAQIERVLARQARRTSAPTQITTTRQAVATQKRERKIAATTTVIAPTPIAMDDRQRSMVGKLATIGQMDAINVYHSTLHLRTFATIAEFRTIVGDMADASVLRASLKAQIR